MLSAESSLLIRRITAGPAGRRPATRPSKKLETAPFETAVAMSGPTRDRKSTRLNSSHSQISYAVFCLKKKNERGCGDQCNGAPTDQKGHRCHFGGRCLHGEYARTQEKEEGDQRRRDERGLRPNYSRWPCGT